MLLALARLATGGLLLGYAAHRDWRTRRVPDAPWALMATAGLLLLGVDLAQAGGAAPTYLVLLPPALLFVDVLWDRPEGPLSWGVTAALYASTAAAVALLVLLFPGLGPGDRTLVLRGLGVLVVLLLGYLFYYLGLLKGGADAKAFMAIGVLVPGYPTLGPFPLLALDPRLLGAFELLFPFALATLLTATLLLLGVPLAFLGRNLARGDWRWPQALLGYRAPLDAPPLFSWVLQEAVDGRIRYYVVPRKRPEEANLEGLRSLGLDRVWVTPQIPFLVPLAVGFLVTFLLGNPFFALV